MRTTARFLAAALLASACNLVAQSGCYIQHLRGTYLGSTTGWFDMSALNPAAPPGLVPMSCAGSHRLDAAGGGSITMVCNINGTALGGDATITSTVLAPDCTGTMEATLKIKGSGAVMPLSVRFIMAPGGEELHLVTTGKAIWSEKLRRVSAQ